MVSSYPAKWRAKTLAPLQLVEEVSYFELLAFCWNP